MTPPPPLPPGTDTVVVATPDIQGRLVGRRVPADRFSTAVEDGIAVASCVYGWDIAQNPELLASGALAYTGMHTGMGDVVLWPDVDTLRRATWLDGTAIVLADAREVDGTPTAVAPRAILRRQIERLAAAGFAASVGTELEYYLFHGSPADLHRDDYRHLRPATVRPADFSILDSDELDRFLAGLRRSLIEADIPVEASQAEWGLGQIETTLVHTDPLTMADRHGLYKLAVRGRAAAAGMTASFMAKPTGGQPGSSCHVHLSLRSLHGDQVFWSDDDPAHLSPVLRQSIAGALTHAPELMAWYAPTVNSYRRVRSHDAAGWGQTWGVDHRFVSVRVVGHTPESLRLEFRLPGADTNPYLTLAGLLASIADGIVGQLDPGPAETGNPYTRDPGPIPQHLGQAVDAFAASEWIRSSFGADVAEHYATINRFEWDQFLDAVTDWERRRYFDTI